MPIALASPALAGLSGPAGRRQPSGSATLAYGQVVGCSPVTSSRITAATASQKTGVYSDLRWVHLDALSGLFVQCSGLP
jgi:hypothetical protein